MNKQLNKEMLAITITDLPLDIYDHISLFLPDKDFVQFLCASRQITVSAYLRRDRQRAHWKKCGAEKLAIKGDLQGLQYLHGIGGSFTDDVMDFAAYHGYLAAAENGHLAVVEFLHSIGVCCTEEAMDNAAENGHLGVVQFLHSIGAPCTEVAMNNAAANGHLTVVEYLHSIGAPYTATAMADAAYFGHLAVVQYLHSIGGSDMTYGMDYALYIATNRGHMAVVEYLLEYLQSFL